MIETRSISYEGDGARMIGHFAVDVGRAGPLPGLLVIPEAPGLDDLNRERAEQLARIGYAALAVDFHGNGQVLTDRPEMLRRIDLFIADPFSMRRRVVAALDALRGQTSVDPGKLGAIGYCFGGTMALELARSGADVQAIVGFHTGLRTVRPEDSGNIRAKILICNGAADPSVPPEQRSAFEREMEAAGTDWQLHIYGGTGHAFSRPGVDKLNVAGFRYVERAHNRSWQAMLNLLKECWGAT